MRLVAVIWLVKVIGCKGEERRKKFGGRHSAGVFKKLRKGMAECLFGFEVYFPVNVTVFFILLIFLFTGVGYRFAGC